MGMHPCIGRGVERRFDKPSVEGDGLAGADLFPQSASPEHTVARFRMRRIVPTEPFVVLSRLLMLPQSLPQPARRKESDHASIGMEVCGSPPVDDGLVVVQLGHRLMMTAATDR